MGAPTSLAQKSYKKYKILFYYIKKLSQPPFILVICNIDNLSFFFRLDYFLHYQLEHLGLKMWLIFFCGVLV